MLKKKGLLVGSLLLSVSMLAACQESESSSAEGEDLEEFVIAYLPQESSEEKAKLDRAFEEDLEKLLGVEVESYQANSYNAAIEAMKNDNADLALFGAFSYIVAAERAGAEALAAIDMGVTEEEPFSVIIVPADSDIESIEDLKGKTMGFADPVSTSGHLMPKSYLIDQLGVTVEDLEKDGEFFKSVQFAGGHDKALIGVVNGQFDAAAISPVVGKMLVENKVVREGSYKVIAEVPQMEVGASGAFAIRDDHTEELKKTVKDFLINYDNEAYFENLIGNKDARLKDVQDNDFDSFRDVSDKLNLSPEELLSN